MTVLNKFDVRHKITSEEFLNEYLTPQRPVLITGNLDKWRALEKWNPEYLGRVLPKTKISMKGYEAQSEIIIKKMELQSYVTSIRNYELGILSGKECVKPPYCHDIPIFSMAESLIEDVSPFPIDYLPIMV